MDDLMRALDIMYGDDEDTRMRLVEYCAKIASLDVAVYGLDGTRTYDHWPDYIALFDHKGEYQHDH